MADTRPTPVTFRRALYLCLLGAFVPDRLTAEQDKDNEARKSFTDRPPSEPAARVVRRAFWSSLALVLLASGAGYAVGWMLTVVVACTTSNVIMAVQVAGAALLLWGTLFVRGWQIQTYSGVTLVERVNRWLFVAMYCFGTALIVGSLALSPCGS